MRLARLIRNLARRDRLERDLDEELRSFVEMSADERRQAGFPEDEARRAALLELGGADQVKERVREARAGARLEQLSRDLSHAARTLRRSPGFTAVALASMALGIGGTTAIFSVMDALYWRPLPVSHPEQLVRIGLTDTLDSEGRQRVGSLTPFHFSSLAGRLDGVFAGVISAGSRDGVSLTVDGATERIVPDAVSLDYFPVLGVPAFRGRTFGATWAAEVVLNHSFWRSRFGSDPAVLGRTILLNGYPFTIVGVAPPGFLGTEVGAYSELWMPKVPPALEASFPAMPLLQRARWYGTTLARLRPGVSLEEARGVAEAAYQAAVREQYGESSPYRGTHVTVRSERRGSSPLRGGYERPLTVLAGLAVLVLLIACANVASLLLGRATARRQEIAIRLALGAGRARLVGQLLTESLLLASLGGALGVWLAYRGADALLRFVPQTHLRTALDVRPDLRVLVFALAAAVLTGILAGLAPALQGTRVELTAALKGGAAAGQRRLMRWRQGLVVGEVALSMVLMVGAALFARTLHNLQAVDAGFDPDDIALFTFKHVHERYSVDQVHAFCRDLLARVAALPGVRAAALSDEGGPFNPRGGNPRTIGVPGSPAGERNVRAQLDRVSPGFFESLALPLLAGRDFSSADRAGAPNVAIVNEPVARVLFPGANPIGRRIVVGEGGRAEEVEVVGVVPGVRHKNLRAAYEPSVYLPLFQAGKPHMPTLFVRAGGGVAAVVPAVRQEFHALDGALPVFNVKTMARQLDETLARERLLATLSSLFAALAALLAAVGLYAVIAQAVVRRTREIGIRMALGARPGGVAWLVMREALGLVGMGMVLGLAAAWASTRLVSTLLFGLTPADPVSLAVAVAFMLAVGALAGYSPARRAALIDPTRALRYE